MKKIIALMFIAAFFTAPVYAEGSGTKPLSILEFSAARENRGMPQRVIDRRYSEYRNGHFAVTTLDTEHIR